MRSRTHMAQKAPTTDRIREGRVVLLGVASHRSVLLAMQLCPTLSVMNLSLPPELDLICTHREVSLFS